jgi:hypothetical protein
MSPRVRGSRRRDLPGALADSGSNGPFALGRAQRVARDRRLSETREFRLAARRESLTNRARPEKAPAPARKSCGMSGKTEQNGRFSSQIRAFPCKTGPFSPLFFTVREIHPQIAPAPPPPEVNVLFQQKMTGKQGSMAGLGASRGAAVSRETKHEHPQGRKCSPKIAALRLFTPSALLGADGVKPKPAAKTHCFSRARHCR